MKRLFPVIFLLLFASCSSKSESSLYTALDLAGNNRHEIQKVLDHYCAPGDSLKRRAAEYLIANMAGKAMNISFNVLFRVSFLIKSVIRMSAKSGAMSRA